MSNQEQGIAQTRIAARQSRIGNGKGLHEWHESAISDLGERFFLYLSVLAFLGLLVLWATATSSLLLYGSLALTMLLTFFRGWLRIRRIDRIGRQRAQQVAALQAKGDAGAAAQRSE